MAGQAKRTPNFVPSWRYVLRPANSILLCTTVICFIKERPAIVSHRSSKCRSNALNNVNLLRYQTEGTTYPRLPGARLAIHSSQPRRTASSECRPLWVPRLIWGCAAWAPYSVIQLRQHEQCWFSRLSFRHRPISLWSALRPIFASCQVVLSLSCSNCPLDCN